MSIRKRQTFSPEFKREAVRLLEQGDKEAAQLARELGIKRNQLYKWKPNWMRMVMRRFRARAAEPSRGVSITRQH